MKKFYVASSFQNKEIVRHVSMRLVDKGFIHTYDWTKNGRASTIEELMEIGLQEKNAVLEADFIIVLLPGGKGSHIELGIALGQGKTIYLYSRNDDINNFETTSTFYHLSNIEKCTGTIDELINIVTTRQIT
ncbi:group-specific protein [Sporosarcina saromensis]|uniref:Group-specific protein n=1 Tax=Sporosarcina saromensis TaxID=359365 RepID=A0ABU4GC24_9BACL|nr:group-specific protein [Sporosarcina saromensis]MDW0114515.1 group-specific protein [Sporosarcina saromensis]